MIFPADPEQLVVDEEHGEGEDNKRNYGVEVAGNEFGHRHHS
jgi:hypothetical protein